MISPVIEKQNLHKLWHVIYSIPDYEDCVNTLVNKFNIGKEAASKLAKIDFSRFTFGNKSVKAIRKILPYLMDGYGYSDACEFAGYNPTGSLTIEENAERKLSDKIENLPKNSLRQPVVEKILNQLINLVNAIIDEKNGFVTNEERNNGSFEINIELARELKQNRQERDETLKALIKTENENEKIRKRLEEEYKVRATRNNVIKWKLFHEIVEGTNKVNATCIYCGNFFGLSDALNGNEVDIEHIIPRSLLYDDSQSNKTLTHRNCNSRKGNRTAFDFMQSKGEKALNDYIERIEFLFKNKVIGINKRNKFLMSENKIPQDFIQRQLRETQYITKKSKKLLSEVSKTVTATTGSVTSRLRYLWGWDDVLLNIQLPKFKKNSLTEMIEWEAGDGSKGKVEKIIGWTKRIDYRHHAIDALTIACTKMGYVQRINTLSSKLTRDEMFRALKNNSIITNSKLSLLENYLLSQKPFETKYVQEEASKILVSFKPGKKVATLGVRKIKKDGKKIVVQSNIIVPRGPLSEESVYGKIKVIEKNKDLKFIFAKPHLIFKTYIRKMVEERISKYNGNSKKALASLKKNPIYLNENKNVVLEHATCYKEEYVIKYPLESIMPQDVKYIVDNKVKKIVEDRLSKFKNAKEAFKEPLYFNVEKKIPIKSVRMLTGLSSVEPVKRDDSNREIGFVKPGNNHHVAFYINENEKDKKIEHICTFWHAVERKKFGLPVIIKNPKEVWRKISDTKNEIEYDEKFLAKLPKDGWVFVESMQQNEMFIIGLKDDIIKQAIKDRNKKLLSEYLYRVQKISSFNYVFRNHIESDINDYTESSKLIKRFYSVRSIGAFDKLNPRKVKVNNLGEIEF